jgi:hypothetical protein
MQPGTPTRRLYVKYDSVADVVFIWGEPAQDHLLTNLCSERLLADGPLQPLIGTMLQHIKRGEGFMVPCSSRRHAEDVMRRLAVSKDMHTCVRLHPADDRLKTCFVRRSFVASSLGNS